MTLPVGDRPAKHRPARTVGTDALAAGQLGVADLVFFTWTATTPLTVIAGLIVTGYAATGQTGIPVSFLLVGGVLAVFAPGFVAMARHVGNAGAFYSFIARGLSRELGVGAAWLALISYNALQVALYGAVGVAGIPVAQRYLGISPPWWAIALIAWAFTAVMGVRPIRENSRVLAVLLVAEIAVSLVYSFADLGHPAGGQISFHTLSPGSLSTAGLGAVLVLALLAFVGFESAAVYSEETRNAPRTVPIAIYTGIGLIGTVYLFASWAMSVATGPTRIVQASRTQGSDLIFNLASTQLGGWAGDIGHLLFVTSVNAALISFHNTSARYAFALGREHVLPAVLGRPSVRTHAPVVASWAQSGIGLFVIILFAARGWDPLVQLFYWGGTSGALGILMLLLLTSMAVVKYFRVTAHEERLWSSFLAPLLAAGALAVMVVLAVRSLPVLFGVPPHHPLTVAVPVIIVGALVLGMIRARMLAARRPDVYASIGHGPNAAAVRSSVNAVRAVA